MSWRVVFALCLLSSASGCASQLFERESYWDRVVAAALDTPVKDPDPSPPSLFLGVRVSVEEQPVQLGVVVLHVFTGSAAERCGLQKGDEIRRLGETAVRTTTDLRRALESAPGGTRTPALVYARDGQELTVPCLLNVRQGWLLGRRRRLFEAVRSRGTRVVGVIETRTRTLGTQTIEGLFGVKLDEPLEVAGDLDVIPLPFGRSLFRWETVPLCDGGRYSILVVPFATWGEDRTADLRGLIPPLPEGTQDL